MNDEPPTMKRVLDNVFVRLSIHYGVLLAIYYAFIRMFPGISEAVARERARGILGSFLEFSGGAGAAAVAAVPPTDVEVLGLIVLVLVGALGIAFPVVLVYQWTSEPESYRRDFSRALLSLPIAVALAVFLVKNNLALAFSLTGIIAVIRWRATLRETMDGVFMFVMIGIGLAAGVQLLLVALVASIVFNLMILTLARTKFAGHPRQLAGWTLSAPVPVETLAKAKRVIAFRVDTADQAQAEARLESILPLCAKDWDQAAAAALPDGRVRLEYRVTLKKSATPESLLSAIANLGVPGIGEVALSRDT